MSRGTFKHHFKQGYRIVHKGITNDLQRRENEHKTRFWRKRSYFEGWTRNNSGRRPQMGTRTSCQRSAYPSSLITLSAKVSLLRSTYEDWHYQIGLLLS